MPATVNIHDWTTKWLKFYELAQDTDPEQRFALWKEHYHFAALPPTEHFLTEARKMLDASWHRYPAALERIRAGASGFCPEPQASLDAVCRVLEFEDDMTIDCVLFVGNFENNPFAFTWNGVARAHFPVETDGNREVDMAHEFTHLLHERLCGMEGYVRPLAVLALMEGLAMHTSRAVVPDRPELVYTSNNDHTWPAACAAKHQEILTGMAPFLAEASQETMWRFTMGTGTTGLQREVYHVGWHVVGHLLGQGRTLAQLARLTQAEIVPLVQQTVAELRR